MTRLSTQDQTSVTICSSNPVPNQAVVDGLFSVFLMLLLGPVPRTVSNCMCRRFPQHSIFVGRVFQLSVTLRGPTQLFQNQEGAHSPSIDKGE